jgi:hypothetical protein
MNNYTKACINCDDVMDGAKRIRLCPVCRRTYGRGALIGGVIAGVVMKLLAYWHWL